MKNIFTAVNMEQSSVTIDCQIGTAIIYTGKAPEKSDNEDSCAVYQLEPNACVLAVADGMGGLAMAQTASEIVVASLGRELQKSVHQENSYRDTILNGIETANSEINQLGVGAGSTTAVVEIVDNIVRPYHVGDSKILIVGGKGKIKLETISHSPTEYAVESGYLEAIDALEHEERHYVTNMLGAKDMRIEIGSPVKLASRDTMVIGSDGLFDNMHIHEIVDTVRKGPLPAVMDKLIQTCKERMSNPAESLPSKKDDLTIILYRKH
jgi:serine/threonine protein phosphatase PrpC